MSTKDGGSAFPYPTPYGSTGGMTLRDYFAGQALVGLASRFDAAMVKKYLDGAHDAREVIVAYLLADAMLAERDR